MNQQFAHHALDLQHKKSIVFTALSKKCFYMRTYVTKYVLDQGKVPLNPFMSFDYFLSDTVDRDAIRNANNNLVAIADELWVFGPISDGVIAEIKQVKAANKPIRYFNFKEDKDITEINLNAAQFEDGLEQFHQELKELNTFQAQTKSDANASQ